MSQHLVFRKEFEFPTQQPQTIPIWLTTSTLIVDIRGSLNAFEVLESAYLIQYQFRDGLGWVKTQSLRVSSNLSQVVFDSSYPYKLKVLPVKGVKQFELSLWVETQYTSTSINLFSGENSLSLRAIDLLESYSLILPVAKPQAGQGLRVASVAGQLEWVGLFSQGDLNAKANINHNHTIAQVDTLQTALNAKPNTSDVSLALSNKADLSHTHAAMAVDWTRPGAIGATAPNTGKFTGLTVQGALQHTGASVGFFNTAPIAKPTVSGSHIGGAALTSLIAALKNLGLINDATTA